MTSSTKKLGSSAGRVFAFLAAVAIVVVLALAWRSRYAAQPVSGTAPDFTLALYPGYDGGLGRPQVRLSDLRGQIVFINFWASWCVSCREEQPVLERIWQRYRARGVVFVGIDYVDTEPQALKYLAEFKVTYPNGPDLGTRVSSRYRIRGVPESFLVDRQGNIVWFKLAPVSERELAAELDRVLAK